MVSMNRELIEGYEIEDRLGEGGMGEVFRGRRLDDGRPVAIKVIQANFLQSNWKEALPRFKREVAVTKEFAHPNVVKILDGGLSKEGNPFLVMELLFGSDLRELVDNEGPLDEQTCIHYARQMASGLAYIHHQGLVHRDIKPKNVFLTRDSRIVLIDFGLVFVVDKTRLTKTKQAVGTLNCMAPEQLLQEEGSTKPPVDVYQVATTLYFCLTGRLPLSIEQLIGALAGSRKFPHITPVRILSPNVSDNFSKFIAKCQQRDPSLRPQSGAELEEELERLSIADPIQGEPSKAPQSNPPKKSILALLCFIILAVLICKQAPIEVGYKGPLKKAAGRDIETTASMVCSALTTADTRLRSAILGQMLKDNGLVPRAASDEQCGLLWLVKKNCKLSNKDVSHQRVIVLIGLLLNDCASEIDDESFSQILEYLAGVSNNENIPSLVIEKLQARLLDIGEGRLLSSLHYMQLIFYHSYLRQFPYGDRENATPAAQLIECRDIGRQIVMLSRQDKLIQSVSPSLLEEMISTRFFVSRMLATLEEKSWLHSIAMREMNDGYHEDQWHMSPFKFFYHIAGSLTETERASERRTTKYLESALKCSRKSLEVAKTEMDKARSLILITNCLQLLDKMDEALNTLAEVKKFNTSSELKFQSAERRASILQDVNRYFEAYQAWCEALDYCPESERGYIEDKRSLARFLMRTNIKK